MKQCGISCKLSNMFINIKVNNNHLLDYFETPHVNSNMFDICKPNCLICCFIHGFGLSSSTCPKIAHQIWQVLCRRIYTVGSQIFDESWKHKAWTKKISCCLFGPKGPTIDLINIATLCSYLLSMRSIKGQRWYCFLLWSLHFVVCVFGPKPYFPSWLLEFHQRHTCEISNVPWGKWWYGHLFAI